MKRTFIVTIILLSFSGVTVFAQSIDMSYYTEEYTRPTGTFFTRLELLETVRDANLTGIGEFYHSALRLLLSRVPDIRNRDEYNAAEDSARIIAQALGEEKYIEAAPDLWVLAQTYDVIRSVNSGLVMQDALIALGQMGATDFVTHIALRLDNFNTDITNDLETRRRVQRGVVGAIRALEILQDPAGFRPVFFASIGWYEISIRTMASVALPNIMEDPGEIISAIIRDSSINPRAKYEAWREMLRTHAPDSSKASVAAVALATGWNYSTSNPDNQRFLRDMRLSALETIRTLGIVDNSVYANLEKSYKNNFITVAPDYDEIRRTLAVLASAQSDEGTALLVSFLRDLNLRRRNGPWGARERQVLQILVPAVGATGVPSQEAVQLLNVIARSTDYTVAEQGWARDALRALNQS